MIETYENAEAYDKHAQELGFTTPEAKLFHLYTNYFSLIVPAYYLHTAKGSPKEAHEMLHHYEGIMDVYIKQLPPKKAEEIDRKVRRLLDPAYDAFLKSQEGAGEEEQTKGIMDE